MCECVCMQGGDELAPFSGQRGWYMEEGRGAEQHIVGMLHHLSGNVDPYP